MRDGGSTGTIIPVVLGHQDVGIRMILITVNGVFIRGIHYLHIARMVRPVKALGRRAGIQGRLVITIYSNSNIVNTGT